MEEKIKYGIYGILLMVVTVGSVLPLKLVGDISDKAFLFAVVSWALGIFIGISLVSWVKRMDELTEVN